MKSVDEIAYDVRTEILKYLSEMVIDPNTAQAALGYAWFSLCQAMGLSKEVFKIMCDGMVLEFEPIKEEHEPRS